MLMAVSKVLHRCVSVSHKETKCLRSVLGHWRGLQLWRNSLSYSLVPCWHLIVRLLSRRVASMACEAVRRLAANLFS